MGSSSLELPFVSHGLCGKLNMRRLALLLFATTAAQAYVGYGAATYTLPPAYAPAKQANSIFCEPGTYRKNPTSALHPRGGTCTRCPRGQWAVEQYGEDACKATTASVPFCKPGYEMHAITSAV